MIILGEWDVEGIFTLALFFALLCIVQLLKSLTMYNFMKTIELFFKNQIAKISFLVFSKLDLYLKMPGFKNMPQPWPMWVR